MGQPLKQKTLEAEMLIQEANNIAGDSLACLVNVLESHSYTSVQVWRMVGHAAEPKQYSVRPCGMSLPPINSIREPSRGYNTMLNRGDEPLCLHFNP